MSRRPPAHLLVPAAITVALLLLPLAYLVLRAAEGGELVLDVLGEHATYRLIGRTTLLVICVAAGSTLVGGSLAFILTRADVPGRRVFATLAAVPLVIPSYVAAFSLLAFFGPRGLLQQALGVDRLPDPAGLPGATYALVLSTYPYVYLLASAALRTLDPSLEDAARALGASRLRAAFRVTLPAVRPALGLGALLTALYALSDFGVVSLMRYDALTRAIFLQYRSLLDRTPAAVLALVLVALTAVAVALEARTRARGRLHRVTPGSERRLARIDIGRWRWLAFAWCVLALLLFLGIPAGVLLYWLGRGIADGKALDLPLAQAVDSLLASGLAAIAATLAALPLALLAFRHRARSTRLLVRLAYGANALPGLVVALSLVFFAARYVPAIYQTLGLLVFAYVVRFLPQALSGSESALERVNPRLEEAARSLGTSAAAATRRVTIPLARSGVVAGAALVFLSAMKELPATLLLRPTGFDTLPTEIWSLTQVGAYSRAAIPALMLIALSAPLLFVLTVRQRAAADIAPEISAS